MIDSGCRGVIFDLFHTLTTVEREWSDLPGTCDVLGIDRRTWDEALLAGSHWRLTGEERDPVAIVRALARAIDPAISEERIGHATAIRIRRFADALQRIPDENLQVLRAIRAAGLRLGLLSNADAMEVAAWRHSPLAGLFDAELFSCDIGCAKPQPESFHACLRALRLAPDECVFVGDGGSDELQGARAVGLGTVFFSGVVERIFPERVAPRAAVADHHIRSMADLPGILGLTAASPAAVDDGP